MRNNSTISLVSVILLVAAALYIVLPVDHPAWPLRHAEVLHLDDRLVAAAGLPQPEGEPRVRWSPGVDVRIGRPTRV